MVTPQKEVPLERPKGQLYRELANGFFRVGIFGFGGGPSSIPLVHTEAVKKYEWMTDDEFGDVLALANTMPGPIATKMAGYIGYRVAGWIGMLIALAVNVIPTVIGVIVLLKVLEAYKELPVVQNMAHAVIPVVTVMLGVLAWDFVKKSGETIGWMKATGTLAVAFIAMYILNIHPAFVILAVFALIFSPLLMKRRNRT
ncbi:chromate transporter [Tetzosporium hominis]|uniref:chromate transporter n=1 Tax=Tetzosporium hominis TaxID=2020506 RepID=UPI001FAFBEFB|nr:chromate transporter [Tetzosporium hominis]